jgi:protein-disulfide isomerase
MEVFLKKGLRVLAALTAVAAVALTVAGPPGYGLVAGVTAALLTCAAVIARSPARGALLTSIVCFASNAYLFSRKWESAKDTDALCNINQVLNCDVVNSSAYSEMFGVPITLFGAAFYAGLAVASLAPADRRLYLVTTAFAGLSLGYSLFLGWVSVQIGAVCVLCISIYVGNVLLLWAGIAGLQSTKGSPQPAPTTLLASGPLPVLAAVFVVVVALGGFSWRQQRAAAGPTADLDAASLAAYYESPKGPVRLDGTEPILGDPRAPYQVVEWADFGCPHCAHAAKELKALVSEHPDIQLRFRVFPLSSQCNPAMEGDQGADRCLAAAAAECALRQERFWEMSTALFENQGYHAPEDLKFMAQEVGLDVPSWEQCMHDPKVLQGILSDAKAGEEAGITGTPSLFVKGITGEGYVLVNGTASTLDALVGAHRSGTRLLPPSEPPSRVQ